MASKTDKNPARNPNVPTPLLNVLTRERRFLRRRLLVIFLLAAALAFLLPALVVAGFDLVRPLRESSALFFSVTLLLLSAGLAVSRLVRLTKRLPTETTVALAVEAEHPEIMDTMICAVELQNRDPATLNAIERQVVLQADEVLDEGGVRRVSRGQTLTGGGLMLLALVVCVAAVALTMSPFAAKARARGLDVITGRYTAIDVKPGNIEIAEGDDITIEATVRRGPIEASIIVESAQGDSLSYSMVASAGGPFTFDDYGVDRGGFRYRIETPVTRSPWYSVSTYTEPEIVDATIDIAPPTYTGIPETQLDHLDSFKAPAGSKITITIETAAPADAAFMADDSATLPFQHTDSTHTTRTLILRDTMAGRVRLKDPSGHILDTEPKLTFECIPNLPPLVLFLSPKEDDRITTDDTSKLVIETRDDYGISEVRVRYSISGRPWNTIPLYTHTDTSVRAPVEKLAAALLDLKGVLQYGDVIALYGEALDNTEPEALIGVTEIRFIEVRPDPADTPPEDGDGGGGGESPETLNVRDLIAGQKTLIRRTWTSSRLTEGDEREALIKKLMAEADTLHTTAAKRYEDLKTATRGLSLGKIGDLFADAINQMGTAAGLLHRTLAEESQPFQQTALSRLIALEIELEKNSEVQKMCESGGGGKGKPKPSSKPSKSQQEAAAKQEQQRQEDMDALQKAISEAERLIARQENLNERMRKSQDASDKRRAEFNAERQQAIRNDTEDFAQRLQKIKDAQTAKQQMDRGAGQMAEAEDDLTGGQPAGAVKHGETAQRHLEVGAKLLKQALEKLQADRFEQTAQALQKLIDEQSKLREAAEAMDSSGKKPDGPKPSQGSGGAMAGKQKGLSEQFKKVMDRLAQDTSDISEGNPQAGKKLADAMAKADTQQIGKEMKRAENALRYERFGRAAKSQLQAEGRLSGLLDDVRDALKTAAPLTVEQLNRMRQKALEQLEEAGQASKGELDAQELKQFLDDVAKNVEGMGNKLQAPALSQGATNLLAVSKDDASNKAGGQLATQLLQHAVHVVEKRLFEAYMKKKLDLSRLAGRVPPDEYDKLVREYFKTLSRSE